MIPRSITVRGFLCYKDEQTIDLDGCDLWVFSGRNGSGKSTLFDAMTFALFGAHRGGKRDAGSLINADSDGFRVVFEFDLGSTRYRIGRSLRRGGRPDLYVARHDLQSDGTERWPRVPETDRDAGLKRWVQEKIGLTYETFTASVLLLQGKAENLLAAEPKVRHQILSGIVDLDSYVRLHKQADECRQRARARAEELRAQLQATAAIEPEVIARAEHEVAGAEDARKQADSGWKRLVDLASHSRGWVELEARRAAATAKQDQASRLIADSEAIARDFGRLNELDAALPSVRRVFELRESIVLLRSEVRDQEAVIFEGTRKLDLIECLAVDNQTHLATILEEVERDQGRQREILARQAALAHAISRAKQGSKLAAEVRRLEGALACYPADLADQVVDLHQQLGHREAWKAAMTSLSSLARDRAKLAEARTRQLAAREAIEAAEVEVERAEAALALSRVEEMGAREAEARDRERATVTITLRREAEDRFARFESLEGASACDRCGQALTPAHFAAEALRLREECSRAAAAAEAAAGDHGQALARLDAACQASSRDQRRGQMAAQGVEAARRRLEQAEREAEAHALACSEAHDQLDDPFRSLVAPEVPGDWADTTFPSAGDLHEGRRLVAELVGARASLKEAQGQLDAMLSDRRDLERARRQLDEVGLQPGDESAETEHHLLCAELDALACCLKGHETARSLAEETKQALAQQARSLAGRVGESRSRLEGVRARVEALSTESARTLAAAPEPWRDRLDSADITDLAAWEKERHSLHALELETRAAELPRAHDIKKQAQNELEEIERRITEVPEEARRDPSELASLVVQSERARDRAEEECRAKQAELDRLIAARDGRSELAGRCVDAERDHAVAASLAQHLGPRGLLRDLIRDAERQIVALANPILREVSGGELELRLIEVGDDETDHALQLEAIERIQGRTGTRGVEYLSGSQKFRVAVSLALAIGQYARGSKERPIESVIIDEGFGSLDRQGRDEMIEQLNGLRGRLARIILVSHQEEFAEAFRDGYQFEVVDGTTRARPFHR